MHLPMVDAFKARVTKGIHLQSLPGPPVSRHAVSANSFLPSSGQSPHLGRLIGGKDPLTNALFCSAGARGIVNSGLIPSLVRKLQVEEEHIQEIILDTLAPCLLEDATEALKSQAVPRFKEKLLSDNPQIRSKAARALIAIR